MALSLDHALAEVVFVAWELDGSRQQRERRRKS
jgi:hypothetical protein